MQPNQSHPTVGKAAPQGAVVSPGAHPARAVAPRPCEDFGIQFRGSGSFGFSDIQWEFELYTVDD